MSTTRTPALLRTGLSLFASVLGLSLLTACPNGDVGSPCNHGTVTPPETKLVTFPALSCDDLICVYGEDQNIPEGGCENDSDCNTDVGASRFQCSEGACRLSLAYVLERSMCSKRCGSDADCKNTGITTDQKPVAEDDTNCETGFTCARIQQLGEFCCEKLCVCNDFLPEGIIDELDMNCETQGPEQFCSDDAVPNTDGGTGG